MAFDFFRRFVFPDDCFVASHFLGAGEISEEDVAVWELPAILRVFGLDLPFDFAAGGEDGHFAAAVVAAEDGACGEDTGGEQCEREKEGFHTRC